jgi:hypothetical protein
MHLFGNIGDRPQVSYREAIERKNVVEPQPIDADDEPE